MEADIFDNSSFKGGETAAKSVVERLWEVNPEAGANIVYTCPPPYREALLEKGNPIEFHPQAVMDKLMKMPYCTRGYAVDGYTPDAFNTHPALLATAKEFSGAT